MKKNLSLITIIFILMVYSITGYKVFGEEFIIPIKYDSDGKLFSNATHYIHSFSVGNTVFTQYKIKFHQSYKYFNAMLHSIYKPYREGTNLFIDVSSAFDLRNVFSTDLIPIRFYDLIYTYSFFYNYINNPVFRTEIKRLANFLDRSGVVYSVYDLSETFNSVLSNNIEVINYLQKFRKYYEESAFIQKIKNFEYYYKWKFKVEKKKFKYDISIGDVKTGQIYLNKSELYHFQEFLDKKKINLKLSEYIKYETTDIEAALIHCKYSWNNLKSYQELTNYFEGKWKTKYYILDLKDFVIGEVETPYWLY